MDIQNLYTFLPKYQIREVAILVEQCLKDTDYFKLLYLLPMNKYVDLIRG